MATKPKCFRRNLSAIDSLALSPIYTLNIPNNMIRLNCFFQATDGDQYKDALRAAVALTEKSRNHAGCIAYDVFQSATRSDVFMFCETWKDDASLKAHSETPEFKKYVAEIEACGQMKLERFEF